MTIYLLLTALATNQPGATPKAETIEQHVLTQRRLMRKGKVVLRSRIYEGQATKPGWDCEYTVWFEGKKNRTEIKVGVHPTKVTGSRWVYGRNFNEGEFVIYSDEIDKTGSPAVEVSARNAGDRFQALMNPDPRMLGLAPTAFANLAKRNLESVIARKDRNEPKLERVAWKNQECWRIDYTDRKGIARRVWVVPSWGYSVVRIESEFKAGGKHYDNSVECDFQPRSGSGLWYPRKCVFEAKLDGQLSRRELVDVVSISLNEYLPPDTFSLAGLGLPKGKAILGLSKRGALFWDGVKAVPQQFAPPRLPPATPMASTRTWLLLASGILATIAVVIGWFFLSPNKQPSA